MLESNGAWLIVRGIGLIQTVDDVKRVVVGASNGVPVYVDQIADVHLGNAFRVASLVKGTNEAVGGVVVARTGVNTKAVIDAVKSRIAQIAPGLPPGVSIVPFYDRSQLIEQSVDTLRTALIEEIVLVTLAHVIFLMHFRSILIVTLPLPLAVLMSFLGMYYAGISSNIMSLAGIAIAIGVLSTRALSSPRMRSDTSSSARRPSRSIAGVGTVRSRQAGRSRSSSRWRLSCSRSSVFAHRPRKLFPATCETLRSFPRPSSPSRWSPCSAVSLKAGFAEEANPVMRGLRGCISQSSRPLRHRVLTIAAAALLFAGARRNHAHRE